MHHKILLSFSALLLICAACSAPGDTDSGSDRLAVFGAEPPYNTEELRGPLQDLINIEGDVDQLTIGIFEGQLLTRRASADRFVRRVQALEPLTVDCLEANADLNGEVARLFAQAMLSEAFGVEGTNGSTVVAFPDVDWLIAGPANPDAANAADESGCWDVINDNSGGVFGGPVGQRYSELVRSDQWRTPPGFEDQFAQAIADHCGADPFEECLDEDAAMVQMLPAFREAVRLNLDILR